MNLIACLGDTSSHNGTLITTNQDGRFKVAEIEVCADQCIHKCPIAGHGNTPVTAITIKSYVNGRLIITYGAQAQCGAIIEPPNRNTYVE